MPGTYIVIPTYNEAENIRGMLNAIQSLNSDYHVIIVDDNSPDGTASVVLEMQRPSAFIHVLRRPAKSGIGSAVMDGIKEALSFALDITSISV